MNEWRYNATRPIRFFGEDKKTLPFPILFGPRIILLHCMLLLHLLLLLILQLLFLLRPFSVPALLFFGATSRFLLVTVVVLFNRLSKLLLGKAVSFLGKGSDSVFMGYQEQRNAVKELCTSMNWNIPENTLRLDRAQGPGLAVNIEIAVCSFVTSGAAEGTRKTSGQNNLSVGRYLNPGSSDCEVTFCLSFKQKRVTSFEYNDNWRPGWCSRYSNSLQAGWFGILTPKEEIFSTSVRTGPEFDTFLVLWSPGLFPEVKTTGEWP
jgi:hypothetical protein